MDFQTNKRKSFIVIPPPGILRSRPLLLPQRRGTSGGLSRPASPEMAPSASFLPVRCSSIDALGQHLQLQHDNGKQESARRLFLLALLPAHLRRLQSLSRSTPQIHPLDGEYSRSSVFPLLSYCNRRRVSRPRLFVEFLLLVIGDIANHIYRPYLYFISCSKVANFRGDFKSEKHLSLLLTRFRL